MVKKIATFVAAILLLLIIPHLFWIGTAGFLPAPNLGRLTTCKSNLKNIGTALEMYSADYRGAYPPMLSRITPGYLGDIPQCPGSVMRLYWCGIVIYGKTLAMPADTYSSSYVRGANARCYTVFCQGRQHSVVNIPPDYPQYDSIQGLISEP